MKKDRKATAREITIKLRKLEGMPEGIHGTVMGSGGRYMIVLNAEENPDQQLATFLHEMTHIYNEDTETGGNVHEIETRTHRQLLKALDLLKQEEKE